MSNSLSEALVEAGVASTPAVMPNVAGNPPSASAQAIVSPNPTLRPAMAAFGRTWGAVKQADGSIKVEIVIQPEVASYLEEAAKTAGEPLTEHLQKCADEAFAMYFSQ